MSWWRRSASSPEPSGETRREGSEGSSGETTQEKAAPVGTGQNDLASRQEENEDGREVFHLALLSHTNVGKTTLARTLLRRDVGEVLDRAHVTDLSTAYTLVENERARLELWDTPGFGDSVRLRQRLEGRSQPLGWLLSQVWDRFADRPLWSSQRAVETLSQRADAVLYLVNAAEDPELAGYVEPELAILQWAGRPVLLLLNQLGDGSASADGTAESDTALLEPWLRFAERFDVIRSVQPLDAFTRCWVQEGLLLQKLSTLVDEDQRELVAELAAAYQHRQRETYRRSVEALATYLAEAAQARQILSKTRASRGEKEQAMEGLIEELEARTQRLMDHLINLHELEGRAAVSFRRQLDQFLVHGTTSLTTEQGALWGGAVSGALGGLTADILAGGLTFGGGVLAGAILGALGGAGLTRAYEIAKLRGEPAVAFSPDFLDRLAELTLLRYLAIAHFGRGRGPFEDTEAPDLWRQRVESHFEGAAEPYRACWSRARREGTTRGDLEAKLSNTCRDSLDELLIAAYPDARELLRSSSR
ncbi:MAG: DUF3482 domain-containing protein [Acidobacteriota bacterium]